MKNFLILVACLAILCVQPAEAVTISLNPVEDGSAISYDGGFTWGDLDTGSPILTTYLSNPAPYMQRAALEFDLWSAIPAGATIQSATLWLYSLQANDSIDVYGYAGNGLIQLDDFDGSSGPIGNFNPPPEGWNVPGLDVTTFVSGLFYSSQYAGFQLREIVPGELTDFASLQTSYGDPFKPYLVIEWTPPAVPEPSTLLLLGSGLVGLVGFRRKFRK